jgi:hypothetical protein
MQITSSAEVTRHKTWDLSWVENPMWIGANRWGVQPHRSRYLYTLHPWLYYLGSAVLSTRYICYWFVFYLLMMIEYGTITTQWLAIFQHPMLHRQLNTPDKNGSTNKLSPYPVWVVPCHQNMHLLFNMPSNCSCMPYLIFALLSAKPYAPHLQICLILQNYGRSHDMVSVYDSIDLNGSYCWNLPSGCLYSLSVRRSF